MKLYCFGKAIQTFDVIKNVLDIKIQTNQKEQQKT